MAQRSSLVGKITCGSCKAGMALVLAAVLSSASAGLAAGRPGFVIEYETQGILPGSGPDARPARIVQRITLDGAGQKLLYEELGEGGRTAKKVILRADAPTPIIYEVLEGKRYKEFAGDLNEIQKERAIVEQNELLRVKSLPKVDREAYLKENYWLRDGGRHVDVTRSAGSKVLGWDTERILVTENQRPIVDGLVAKLPVGGSGGPFQLYRRLGAFSDEVLEKLEKTDGILLAGQITVVTALRANLLKVEAKRAEPTEVDPAVFEITGLQKVDDTAAPSGCPVCGKSVDPKRPGGKLFQNGVTTYFCSEACVEKYLERDGLAPSKK